MHAYQSTLAGAGNAFVAKLDPSASGAASLLYSSYLGGNWYDQGQESRSIPPGRLCRGIHRVDRLPYPERLPEHKTSSFHTGFVAKLNPSASGAASLLYSTYLGGSKYDYGERHRGRFFRQRLMSRDRLESTDFPTLNPYQSALAGTYNAFVAKSTRRHRAPPRCFIRPSWAAAKRTLASASRWIPLATPTSQDDIFGRLPHPERLPEHYRLRVPQRLRGEAQSLGVRGGLAALFDLPRRRQDDAANGIAVDSCTRLCHRRHESTNFPTQNAYQGTLNGGRERVRCRVQCGNPYPDADGHRDLDRCNSHADRDCHGDQNCNADCDTNPDGDSDANPDCYRRQPLQRRPQPQRQQRRQHGPRRLLRRQQQ